MGVGVGAGVGLGVVVGGGVGVGDGVGISVGVGVGDIFFGVAVGRVVSVVAFSGLFESLGRVTARGVWS